MPKGKLITLEGSDGSGKTTQWNLLREKYEDDKENWLFTRNPGGTVLGLRLREILLHDDVRLSSKAELLLYIADRAEHVEKILRPALEAGKTVICDRYIDSTLVYQGYGRDLDKGMIGELNKMAVGDYMPDLTVLLDVNPEIALSRAEDPNKFEAEGLQFQQKVRVGFREIAEEESERFLVVNSTELNIEQVHQRIIDAIEKL